MRLCEKHTLTHTNYIEPTQPVLCMILKYPSFNQNYLQHLTIVVHKIKNLIVKYDWFNTRVE